MKMSATIIAASVAAGLAIAPAAAKDTVRAVDSTPMPFEHFAIHQAKGEGYFDKADLDVSIIFGRGGADTLQALVTGSQDVAVGVGVLAVIGAHAKGAPVMILGNMKRGASELFWYVPAASPIRTFKDLDGKELVFSSPGSTTSLAVNALLKEIPIKPKLVAVGAMAASRTQVMSGQVATGWATFPSGVDQLRKGEIHTIRFGNEIKALEGTTMRVVAANSDWVKKNKSAAVRFMQALWQGQEFNYKGGEPAFQRYAEQWKIDIADAREGPKYVKFEDVSFAPIGHLDRLIEMAHEYEFIKEPMTAEQRKALVEIVYDPSKKLSQ
jgi:NitT/TauT family transport system substrate-binding protein